MAGIPQNRAVTGEDLEQLRQNLATYHQRDISREEMCSILRIQRARWTSITGKDPVTKENNSKAMLKDFAIALLVRLYDAHPELAPVEKMLSAKDLHSSVGGTYMYFAGMLGKRDASAYRWIEKAGTMSPVVERLGKHLYQQLEIDNKKGSEKNRKEWEAMQQKEAELRGEKRPLRRNVTLADRHKINESK